MTKEQIDPLPLMNEELELTTPYLVCVNCGKTYNGNTITEKPRLEQLSKVSLCPECLSTVPDIDGAVNIIKWAFLAIIGIITLIVWFSLWGEWGVLTTEVDPLTIYSGEFNIESPYPICENCKKPFQGSNFIEKPMLEKLSKVSLCPECISTVPDIRPAVRVVKWFLVIVFTFIGLNMVGW